MSNSQPPIFPPDTIPSDDSRTDVLLVDDDCQLATSLELLLRHYGYVVATVSEGRAALQFLARNPVALVVSDIFMPKFDGLELLRVLRNNPFRPRLVAMSGNPGLVLPDMLTVAALLGAERILPKPFEPGQFVGVVREMIGPPANPPRPAMG